MTMSGVGHVRSKIPTDDLKLVSKKFKDSPVSPLEVKQCAAELSSDLLAKLSFSHKVCMGRVGVIERCWELRYIM